MPARETLGGIADDDLRGRSDESVGLEPEDDAGGPIVEQPAKVSELLTRFLGGLFRTRRRGVSPPPG